MNYPASHLKPAPELVEIIEQFLESNTEFETVNICTVDGFNILTQIQSGKTGIEPDKLSAISSTLCSLGKSTADQLLKEEFRISSIETNNGSILILLTNYQKHPCVLTITTQSRVSLGEARYQTKRLSDIISGRHGH